MLLHLISAQLPQSQIRSGMGPPLRGAELGELGCQVCMPSHC
jgi:hypothetical protein